MKDGCISQRRRYIAWPAAHSSILFVCWFIGWKQQQQQEPASVIIPQCCSTRCNYAPIRCVCARVCVVHVFSGRCVDENVHAAAVCVCQRSLGGLKGKQAEVFVAKWQWFTVQPPIYSLWRRDERMQDNAMKVCVCVCVIEIWQSTQLLVCIKMCVCLCKRRLARALSSSLHSCRDFPLFWFVWFSVWSFNCSHGESRPPAKRSGVLFFCHFNLNWRFVPSLKGPRRRSSQPICLHARRLIETATKRV